MKRIAVFMILCLVFSQIAAAETEDGGYAGAFLKLAVQARPAGMGGAYIGVSDDAAGQLFNPAGAPAVQTKTIASSYRVMDLGRKLGFVSFMLPTRGASGLGLSWLYAGYGEVDTRNSSGQKLGGTISSSENDFGLTFGKQFAPFLGVGTKLNYYYKRLSDLSATSIGINMGIMISIDSLFQYGSMEGKPITDIKAGLVFSHLAANYSWSDKNAGLAATQDDKFPNLLGLGVSCRAIDRKLLVALDLEKNFKQALVSRFGAEYDFRNRLLLRGGLNEGAVTAGMGYTFALKKATLCFNYAFSAERTDEGSDHIISLDLKF